MRPPILFLIWLLASSCNNKPAADIFFYHAKIYTLNPKDSIADAMVVRDGKILSVGSEADLSNKYTATNRVDLKGQFVYPGFIDAHCHFFEYAMNLAQADLTGTTSWDDVLQKVLQQAASNSSGWLLGKGWDQNDWKEKDFPTKEKLDSLFPDRPVFLERIDGHACIVNQAVLNMTKIDGASKIPGGEIILKNGKPTGVLLDNAMDSVITKIPKPSAIEISAALLQAQRNCFAVGLTTLDDAGLEKKIIDIIDSLQKTANLKIRMYAMATDNEENKKYYFAHGPYKTDRLDVRAFKYYADGALGSRGALLLKPYTDAATKGLQKKPTHYFEEQAQLCYNHGFQMCTHAIGDSANRMMLHIYGEALGGPNDRRWRIEHCQVIAPGDFELFHQYNIIPSVQPTHATSDMYWAADRLGIYRIKGAYAYKFLLAQNGWIADGSDFPVENINPLYGYYAAVSRKDKKGFPPDGFQTENALTRYEALQGMTIWAAMANFEENEKGSLEPGKFADFVVLEKDIMTIPIEQTFSTTVLATYVNGEKVN
ncbi:MAG: amidohydrolase [Chitinophagales bacterium]|nr:amidohydrolase [Chitinophagales bacterium]